MAALQCLEVDVNGLEPSLTHNKELGRRAYKDTAVVLDERVFQNTLNLQLTTTPTCDYFTIVQRDVKPYMRKVVTSWMLEVSFPNLTLKNVKKINKF